ncbi:MAG TPA: PDZ domain-containing protein [Steroidobacteraceae bacterium]|nr:PDZ domain-containing protein [Steroidobacteraceae bacterium]
MKTTFRPRHALLGTLLALAAGPLLADTKPAESAPADEAQLERRLEDAQKRLEQAAKEIAELSAGLVPQQLKELKLHVGEPHAMLGVQLAPGQGGARVARVSPGGPAAEAGVKSGDLIISVNGHHTASSADVSHEMHALKPGDRARLDILRDGKPDHLDVTTRALDPRVMLLGGDFLAGPLIGDLSGIGEEFRGHGGWGELELAALSPDLGRYFGAERGVLVVKAPSDGSLKLRDGDVISAIDGREPQGVSHALRILRSYQPGEHVTLSILRDHKAQKLELTMPARPVHSMRAVPPVPPAPPAPAAPPAPPAPGAPPAPPAPPHAGET